jgi:hypothetical protein
MPKRIFTSFAIEDERTRDLFVGQARNERVPYEIVDMSVKKPWDEDWKKHCESRIKGCDGVIVLITQHLKKASGAIWEINCAKKLGKPILGVYMNGCDFTDAPEELIGIRKINWTWPGIAEFVNNV